jgi:hypothetical protein
MDTSQSPILIAGLLFLIIYLAGFRLSRKGKPYNPLLYNLHKLVGLSAGVYLGVIVCRTHQSAPLDMRQAGMVVVTALSFVATVVTGGLVSIDKPLPAVVTRLHRLFPHVTILGTGVFLYLLFFNVMP